MAPPRKTAVDEPQGTPGAAAVTDDEPTPRSRVSTAQRVADVLRRRIADGELAPGVRLSEEQLVKVLGVSRNTLREAFRLLTHEGLLVYRLNRGVFVPELDEDDLVDLYRLRRVVECEVVRSLEGVDAARLRPLYADLAEGEAAARRGDWAAVGTANMHFHRHLTGLAGSRRIDELTERLLAELRLAFHAAESPRQLHEPYLARNRALLDLLARGELGRAAEELDAYLHDSQTELLDAVRSRHLRRG